MNCEGLTNVCNSSTIFNQRDDAIAVVVIWTTKTKTVQSVPFYQHDLTFEITYTLDNLQIH